MDENLYHILVPAYHEAQNIYSELKDLDEILEKESFNYNLSVIDDGSEDGTYEEILSLAEERDNISPITYSQNHGKGYALREGFRKMDGEPDYVLFFDADGDIRPESVVWMIRLIGEKDVLAASKWHTDSEVNYPLTRVFLSKIFSILTRSYLDLKIKDTQTGLKMFRYEVLEDLIQESELDGYAFDTELLYLAKKNSYNINEAPVKLEFGYGSSLNIKEMVKIFHDVLRIRF